MRVGGGLRYVTGPMGAGKSLYGVRAIVARLTAGQYVVTNVRLGHYEGSGDSRRFVPGEGFADVIARHHALSARKRQLVADKVRRFYVFESDLGEARRYRPPGRGESRALFLWDEAHNDLNNRTYRDRDQALLEWFTQLRKLGYEGVLLSQSQDNTDAQLRRVCNWLVRLQNQREATRLLGMRVSRGLPPLFLAWWYMANVPQGSRQKPVATERYFLSWHRRLYDTLDLYHGLSALPADEGERAVLLPEGGLPAPSSGAGLLPRGSVAGPAPAAGEVSG